MISRPLVLRLLPARLRASVWSRCFHPTAKRYYPLFEHAPLTFAPGIHMRVVPGDIISASIAFTGAYELPLTRLVKRLAKEGGRMVDVGANIGYFSLLWAAANHRNSVIAFEPSSRNVELLKHNVSSNRLVGRIEIRTEAVNDITCEVPFDPGPEEQTGWGRVLLTPTERSRPVPAITLDDALAGAGQVDFLKIDVEGAETRVLQGAARLLRERRIKHITWEQNKPCMRWLNIPENETGRLLSSVGYRITPQGDPRNECVQWYARCV